MQSPLCARYLIFIYIGFFVAYFHSRLHISFKEMYTPNVIPRLAEQGEGNPPKKEIIYKRIKLTN